MKFIKIPYRRRHMKGKGLGGLFAKLSTFVKPLLKTAMRAAKPLAKKTLKEIGRHGMTASSTVNDMLTNNMSLKEAAKKNVSQGLKNVKKTAARGAKRAVKASAREVMKDIKRKKQTGSGTVKKKKKGGMKKKKNSKRPYRGIFQ